MRLWDIGFVAARIAAVAFGLYVAANLIASAGYIWQAGNDRWPQVIGGAIGLVVAALVWFGAERIADEITFDADELRPEDHEETGARPSSDRMGLAAIAFGIAGILFAALGGVFASHTVFRMIIRALGASDEFLGPGDDFFAREDIASLLSSSVRIGVGGAMFWFREQLAGLLVREPSPGADRDDAEASGSSVSEGDGPENIWER